MGANLHMVQLSIPGCLGQLEGRLCFGEGSLDGVGVILCPPHPLLAGNMENNVIQAVAEALAPVMPVLLFNYPAVGQSTSPQPGVPLYEVWNALDQNKEYGAIVAEVRAVIKWSTAYFAQYHLVGYSFGACMALAALTEQARSYTAIAPPLAEEDFSALANITLPVCCIGAEKERLLQARSAALSPPHHTNLEIQGADHFFRGREQELAQRLVAFIKTCS